MAVWLLVCLLPALPTRAEPTPIEMEGWPRWQAAGGPLRFTEGAALADEAQGQTLEWLQTQAEQHADSRALWLALQRRLKAEGRDDEAFGCLLRALELPDRELLLEAAAGHLKRGQSGAAVEAVRQAGLDWNEPLKRLDAVARLHQQGWQFGPSLTLQRDGRTVWVSRSPAAGRRLWLGSRPVWFDGTSLVLEEELCLRSAELSSQELTSLLFELSSDGSISETVGFSVQGRPIQAVRLGQGDETVMLFGAFHGDEPAGPHLVNQLLALLKAQPERLQGKTVVLIPVLNPDGLQAGTRANARGVDLNRNYAANNWTGEGQGSNYWGGPRPASEPETRVVVDLLERYRPVRILSIHQPLHNVNYDGPAAELAAKLSRANGYKIEPDIGYPTPGSFGTYAGRERKIPTITLELPEGQAEQLWRTNREALLRFIEG